ncbi:hypothetical protein ATDW_21240 [Asticcacaulis sp. DW145]|uniref:tetratricopeptide repeat protein n=1 Tax=Asticcacaulis sp. DW145 TaxID=3095608 RepID=UPI00308DEA54|nr:hypothetical protein ATDW_21240 [Asticcacaulis sp. DW145]
MGLTLTLIEYFTGEKSTKLVHTFTHLGNRELAGMGYGGAEFFDAGYDVIAFKTNVDHWYQDIPKHIFETVRARTLDKGYLRRITYGGSMGGFGALAFSRHLEADTALVFSPQISLGEAFDKRWDSYLNKFEWAYPINSDTFSEKIHIIAIYDPMDIDAKHIDLLKDYVVHEKFTPIQIPFAGHATPQYLSEIKILRRLVLQLAEIHSADGFDIYSERKNSWSYHFHLGLNLLHNKKYQSSLRVFKRALIFKPIDADTHRLISTCLQYLRDYTGSTVAAKQAVNLSPTFQNYDHLSYQQMLSGEWGSALLSIESALLLSPDNEGLIQRKEHLVHKLRDKGSCNTGS